jgi:hypothetical protein
LQSIGIISIILFIFFGIKHVIGLRKVQLYLVKSHDDFVKNHDSGFIQISNASGIKNKAAYEYIWSQRYSEHKDIDFVLLCSTTFKSGLSCIAAFVIIILCI